MNITNPLKLDVTQALIDGAPKSSMCQCPIALSVIACLGLKPGDCIASIGPTEATFAAREKIGSPWRSFRFTPKSAHCWEI